MKIIKMAVGNAEEAYIEDKFANGINIIFSNENNKGKTIVIQSMMYTLGNKPIFPDSFEYKKYYHYIEFEHNEKLYSLVRIGDSFAVKMQDGIRIFDGVSEFKRFWNTYIFLLPQIIFNNDTKIVDMELFLQMFFVGQDGKDTSDIFNSGYYHKDDFRNMIKSFAGNFESTLSDEEIKKIKNNIKLLDTQKQEQLKIWDFYQSSSVATEYLSRIKDHESFQTRITEIETILRRISEVRKNRTKLASQKTLWNTTLKDLNSLNRNIEVGELRCMNCNSTNIAYKGKGKITYSFDISTKKMRDQIIKSINEQIASYDEEISVCDFEIEQLQKELRNLMNDDEITLENILAYKQGYYRVEDIESSLLNLDDKIKEMKNMLDNGIKENKETEDIKEEFYISVINHMNHVREIIDPAGTNPYQDLFTKRGTVASGSEETVFYVSKLIAISKITNHSCPIIMDSFRAEDLSTDKEKRVIELLQDLSKQCILTTTLKTEEKGKYDIESDINGIDYTEHISNKLLDSKYATDFKTLLSDFHILF